MKKVNNKNRIFKVTKSEVNKCYAQLIKYNFREEVQSNLIDFDIETHTDSRVTNEIYIQLNNYVNNHSDNLNASVEKIRVEHIIDTYRSGATDKREFAFNYIGVYTTLFCIFIQSWLESIGSFPGIISNLLSGFMFISIIYTFVKGAGEISSIDDEVIFKNNFELLFYTLYLDVLSKYNSNTE